MLDIGCEECKRISAEKSKELAFGYHTLCDECREALIAKVQRKPLPGKPGNHAGLAGLGKKSK